VSTPIKYLLKVLPSVYELTTYHGRFPAWCLDLGGGNGHIGDVMKKQGYCYVNVDIGSDADVIADAHALPFKDKVFSLVISKDSLEHFYAPKKAVEEVVRALSPGGWFIAFAPFMWPFHSQVDYWRFTHMGLKCMLSSAGLTVSKIDNPLWIFTILSVMASRLLSAVGLRFIGRMLRRLAYILDDLFAPELSAFAAGYRVIARKE